MYIYVHSLCVYIVVEIKEKLPTECNLVSKMDALFSHMILENMCGCSYLYFSVLILCDTV